MACSPATYLSLPIRTCVPAYLHIELAVLDHLPPGFVHKARVSFLEFLRQMIRVPGRLALGLVNLDIS